MATESSVVESETTTRPAPAATPSAAATQIALAVVSALELRYRICMSRSAASSVGPSQPFFSSRLPSLLTSADVMVRWSVMMPAPRNPTPVATLAATRAVSPPGKP